MSAPHMYVCCIFIRQTQTLVRVLSYISVSVFFMAHKHTDMQY